MSILKTGDNVSIKFKISSIKIEEITCIVKWVEPDRICLEFPKEKRSVAYYLPEEKEISIYANTQSGVHVFSSIVINSPLENDFIVEFYDDELDTVQRRQFVRVPFVTQLSVSNEKISFSTKTIDISGGGIKFVADSNIAIGQNLKFSLFSPSLNNSIHGNGIIINKKLHRDSIYAIMQFTSISEQERSKIIKLCFEQQASARRGH